MDHDLPAGVSRAVNHRLRRRILRRLHDSREPLSPSRLAGRLQDPLSTISYHVKVLRGCGTVARAEAPRARGAAQQGYSSLVADDPGVRELLDRTKEDDERRAPPG